MNHGLRPRIRRHDIEGNDGYLSYRSTLLVQDLGVLPSHLA